MSTNSCVSDLSWSESKPIRVAYCNQPSRMEVCLDFNPVLPLTAVCYREGHGDLSESVQAPRAATYTVQGGSKLNYFHPVLSLVTFPAVGWINHRLGSHYGAQHTQVSLHLRDIPEIEGGEC